MNKMNKLPDCVKARRVGHWSMGSENEYDAMGEQAPITWFCNCGARLTLEHYDYNKDQYIATPESHKAEFLAAHTTCVAQCFVCGKGVDMQDAWCDECTELDDLTRP